MVQKLGQATKATLILLMMFTLCGGLVIAANPDAQRLVRVPKARYLFGISAAPTGHALLFYRSHEVPEGEVTSGTAVLVKLKTSPEILPLEVPSTVEDLALPVWKKGGQKAYILTSNGIYSVSAETGASKLVLRGALAGLAISSDGTRLASWNLSSTGTEYTLVVFDASSGRNVQTWKVQTQFDGNQYGHEIVFSSDGSSIFARTYDQEDRTPLERFDIGSGEVRTVWPNCTGLASGSKDIYFVGDNHGASTLFKLGPTSALPRKVVASFHFDSLMSSGTQRWVIAVNDRSRALAVLDSETGHLVHLPSWCESAGVLGTGQAVCSRGGDLVLAGRPPSRDTR